MLTIYSLNYLFYRVNVNHSPLAKCSNSCLYSAWMGILLWIWNFQGYQRNSMWNFQGFLKNDVEFWRSTKKKCCGISRGLSFQGSFFLALEFARDLTQFCGISRGWELFCLEFPIHQPIPTRENGEHPGNFQNKSVSSASNWVPPFYFLKWNSYFTACKRKFLGTTSQFSFKFCINLQCHQA